MCRVESRQPTKSVPAQSQNRTSLTTGEVKTEQTLRQENFEQIAYPSGGSPDGYAFLTSPRLLIECHFGAWLGSLI
jgi:hypothetical protein